MTADFRERFEADYGPPFEFPHGKIRHRVYRRGEGPAVLLMHELPGLTEPCAALADRLVEEGFTIYLPLLIGEPGDDKGGKHFLKVCISAEFSAFANKKSSPITVWLRALCSRIQEDRPGPIGAIGMCLTGGFVLSLIVGTDLVAPVTCQPAMPLTFPVALPGSKSALGIDEKELQQAVDRVRSDDLQILGMRFEGDRICPAQRFATLRATFGERFLEPKVPLTGSGHSVLTGDLAPADQTDHPTRKALDQTIEFLRDRLPAVAEPAGPS